MQRTKKIKRQRRLKDKKEYMTFCINRMSEIVKHMYECDVTGVEVLKYEEAFDQWFQLVNEKDSEKLLSLSERQEFICLEYEYELLQCYKYSSDSVMREQCLKYFIEIVNQVFQHQRMDVLVNKIFMVPEIAVKDHINILKEYGKKNTPQISWIWEAFGKEFLNRKNYILSNECYWAALDGYIKIADSMDRALIFFTFYDGQSELYISDLIYRIYDTTAAFGLWNEAEKNFTERQNKLSKYQYFNFHYAAILYNCSYREEEREEQVIKLNKALAFLDRIDDDDKIEEIFEIKCASLYDLERYEEVINCCKKAVDKYSNISELGRTRSFAFRADITLLNKYSLENQPLKANIVLADGASHLEHIPLSAMDSAKMYIPIFQFYEKIKLSVENISEVCILLMDLLRQTNYLKKVLVFYDNGKQLGYYTTLSSLFYLLSDEKGDVRYRLSIFDARHMNDPNEGQVLEQYFNSRITQKIKLDSYHQKRQSFRKTFVFLKSFTTKMDSLPMWVQYANDGRGCLITINPDMFSVGDKMVKSKKFSFLNDLFTEDDYHLYNVAYFNGIDFITSEGKVVTTEVDEIRSIYEKIIFWYEQERKDDIEVELFQAIDNILSRAKYLIKRDDYNNEDEIRVMFFRTGNEGDIEQTGIEREALPKVYIHSTVETQIKEIVLGPKIRNGYDIVPYIYKQLEKMYQEKIQITQSGIEYV